MDISWQHMKYPSAHRSSLSMLEAQFARCARCMMAPYHFLTYSSIVWLSRSSNTNDPYLDPKHSELLAFIRKPLVAEGQAGRTMAALERIVEPQAIASVAGSDAEVVRLAEHVVFVHTAVRKGLEADGLG